MAFDYRSAAAGTSAGVARGGPPNGAVRFTAESAVSGPARIRIPAVLEALDQVAQFVLDLGRRGGLSSSGLYRLRLAADELATNIVMHGYRGAPGEIVVEGAVESQRVWVRFHDDAPPFDPRQGMRAPALDAPLSERQVGGLGVFLACTSVDAFRYELVAGRNVSTLEMQRRPAGGGPPGPRDPGDKPATE
ncbi:ATP-binding protein [Streptomyces sp. NPDC088387]|uniref:ATP-binding protein n=1 Tax=Streptomyces sp. NPDC088387 TaxID=3365859 RepID=UPI0037FD9B82